MSQKSEKKVQFTERDLSEQIKTLYLYKPYYGYILSRFEREITHEIPTAAVVPVEKRLLINPDYISGLKDEVKTSLLEHEVLHIGLLHYERFFHVYEDAQKHPEDPSKTMYTHAVNLATDCAINQLISPVDEAWVSLKSICEMVEEKDLKEKQNAEYYYKKLISSKKFQDTEDDLNNLQDILDGKSEPKSGFGKDFLEKYKEYQESQDKSHGKGFEKELKGKSRSETRDILQKAKKMQKRFDRTKNRGDQEGNSIVDYLPDYHGRVHKHIWKQLIDKNFGDEPIATKSYYYGRDSRRFPGRSNWYTKHNLESKQVYVGIDTSGSVSDDELQKFLGYIGEGMKKNNCHVTMLECDSKIHNIRKLKKLRKNEPVDIHGRGGTTLTLILDYIEKVEKNLKNIRLILLTDGGTPWRDSKIKTSVVYSKNHCEISPIWNSAVIDDDSESQ